MSGKTPKRKKQRAKGAKKTASEEAGGKLALEDICLVLSESIASLSSAPVEVLRPLVEWAKKKNRKR
jgi:hypothetical protein